MLALARKNEKNPFAKANRCATAAVCSVKPLYVTWTLNSHEAVRCQFTRVKSYDRNFYTRGTPLPPQRSDSDVMWLELTSNQYAAPAEWFRALIEFFGESFRGGISQQSVNVNANANIKFVALATAQYRETSLLLRRVHL